MTGEKDQEPSGFIGLIIMLGLMLFAVIVFVSVMIGIQFIAYNFSHTNYLLALVGALAIIIASIVYLFYNVGQSSTQLKWHPTTGWIWSKIFKEYEERLLIDSDKNSSDRLKEMHEGTEEYPEPEEITTILSIIEELGKKYNFDFTTKRLEEEVYHPYNIKGNGIEINIVIAYNGIQILVKQNNSQLNNPQVEEFRDDLLQQVKSYLRQR